MQLLLVSLVVLAMVGLALGASSPEPLGKGVILLVRHAERAPAPMSDDPPLTDAGRARAERLATLLAAADVRAVFTRGFGAPRKRRNLSRTGCASAPIVASDPEQLLAELRTRGNETVLVVGHSDTVPGVIQAFGGPAVTIGDDAFDDLFVLVPATGAFTRLKY